MKCMYVCKSSCGVFVSLLSRLAVQCRLTAVSTAVEAVLVERTRASDLPTTELGSLNMERGLFKYLFPPKKKKNHNIMTNSRW
jgi:hypothetical protein